MKPRWTLFATSLFALALAMVAFHRDKDPAPAAGSPAQPAPGPKPFPKNALSRSTRPKSHPGSTNSRQSRGDDASTTYNGPTRSLARKSQDTDKTANNTREPLTQAEWENRARLVERDADHELARLIPLLDLSPEQQQRVFQALARTSPNFVPGMQVDGTALQKPATTAQQTLLAELTDPQVTAYLQDSNERSAWWTEYINTVSAQLQNGTPAIGGGATVVASLPAADSNTTTDTTPATKEAHAVTGDE